jgi:colanic acid/amylovoran biosynthesis glycosyltransferase
MAGLPPLDVVHAQFATLGLLALRHRRYGTLRTRALVVHLRGYDVTRHVRDHGPGVYDVLFREAELFLSNSEHFRQAAIALGCAPGKIRVIGSPIDTDHFAPPPGREAFEGRPLRLVAVGRLVEKKGFADAVDAVARLRAEGRDVTLDLIGDGPLMGELRRRAGEGVALHGAADADAVLAALHWADVALAPSVTAADGDQDGPVNTLKEAMATGLPVVGTHHGGIPELVDEGNGLLVPERDPAALARAVAQLMDAPGDWARLGAAGRRKVVALYGRMGILRATVEAYRDALRQPGDAP